LGSSWLFAHDPEELVSRYSALTRGLLVIVVILASLVATLNPDAVQAAHRHRQKQDIKTDVVRGIPVPDGKYPFVAAIGLADAAGNFKRQFCGGSLIAPSYVLTAAHCVAGARIQNIAVVVGQAAFGTGQGETRTLAAIMIHPAYNHRNLKSDVAVLRLNAPISTITPVTVVGANDGSYETAGTALTFAGWGNTVRSTLHRNKTRYPERLKEGFISVVSDSGCAKKWHSVGFRKSFAPALLICTSARRFGAGDSGSPLFSTATGSFVQVSLVSGGFVGTKKKISDFGPQLSEPSIAGFIASAIAS
jgi:secreted trypsin-like serine protease